MFGILGINERNIHYIKKFNEKKSITFVTDKYKTKEFLAKRWIPVPETFAYIKNKQELQQYDFTTLSSTPFVIKPNRGSGWHWIIIIESISKQKEKTKKRHQMLFWYLYKYIPLSIWKYSVASTFVFHTTNKTYTQKHLYSHLRNIIDGQYRLWDKEDTILIEEKIIPHKDFLRFCQHGLADLRVIVFNMIPVAAMIRIPTKSSKGKANLAQWWLACGIDISTGKIISLYTQKGGKLYKKNFPLEYKEIENKKLPFRDEILLFSAKAQYFLNIWYVGIDWVISTQWPKVLEVNARSGIEIQNITQQPLWNILAKLHDLNVPSPEKGIEISKSLFSPHKTTTIEKTIYLSQNATLTSQKAGETKIIETIATISTKKKKNYLTPSLAKKLFSTKGLKIHLPQSNLTLITNFRISKKIKGNKVVLWTDTLANYVIKTIHKVHTDNKLFGKNNILSNEIEELQLLDQKIHTLERKINIKKATKPTNYLEEFDTFVRKKWRYNPVFTYNYPSKNKVKQREDEYNALAETYLQKKPLQSHFAQLLYEKITYLKYKIHYIKACKQQNFEQMLIASQSLFWKIHAEQVVLSKKSKEKKEQDLWKTLSFDEIYQQIQQYLKQKKLHTIQIMPDSSMLSRISIGYKRNNAYIKLSTNTKNTFKEKELTAKLWHEIDIHIQRFLNGQSTGRNILAKWTAHYITQEEWLAIRYAEKILQQEFPEYHNINIYRNYNYLIHAQQLDFRNLACFINTTEKNNYTEKKYVALFNRTLKFKRWVQDTNIVHQGACYFKDKIYLDGYLHIKKYMQEGGSLDKLLIGKIKTQDIDFIL